jgi:hypothetical protein
MATTNKIIIGIDDQVVELTGVELETFLANRAQMQFEADAYQAELDAKAIQKSAILERLGLTEEELKVVLS